MSADPWLLQLPPDLSRNFMYPSAPSAASQYLVPAAIGTPGSTTVFQPPESGGAKLAEASRLSGALFTSE